MAKNRSSLRFPYIKNKPKIVAKMSYKDTSKYFEFLVDSGADYTLIPKSIAIMLGIKTKDLKQKTKLELANSSFTYGAKINLRLNIENLSFNLPVFIVNEEFDALLGRIGLFNEFDVLFRENHGEILLLR